jgi:hypothetical protein
MYIKLSTAFILAITFEYCKSVSSQQQYSYKSTMSLNTATSYKSISARYHTKCVGICTQDSE